MKHTCAAGAARRASHLEKCASSEVGGSRSSPAIPVRSTATSIRPSHHSEFQISGRRVICRYMCAAWSNSSKLARGATRSHSTEITYTAWIGGEKTFSVSLTFERMRPSLCPPTADASILKSPHVKHCCRAHRRAYAVSGSVAVVRIERASFALFPPLFLSRTEACVSQLDLLTALPPPTEL